MNMPALMNESEFHVRVDKILLLLEGAFDDVASDIDSQLTSGILTITFENDTKLIVNRQTPNREIWVAAKSGGFHFRYMNSDWFDTRSSVTLATLLTNVIIEQSGLVVPIRFD